jgi:small subunit ribosomal protein S8
MTDPIADFLTRIRNAQMAKHKVVEIPASNIKKSMFKIFKQELKFIEDTGVQGVIKIALKYNGETKQPVIKNLQRISTPGLRLYKGSDDLPRVLNGLGIAIISTSAGLMTDKVARAKNVGGEVLCYVY